MRDKAKCWNGSKNIHWKLPEKSGETYNYNFYTLLSEADKSSQRKIIMDTKFSSVNKLDINLAFASPLLFFFFKKILLKYTLE